MICLSLIFFQGTCLRSKKNLGVYEEPYGGCTLHREMSDSGRIARIIRRMKNQKNRMLYRSTNICIKAKKHIVANKMEKHLVRTFFQYKKDAKTLEFYVSDRYKEFPCKGYGIWCIFSKKETKHDVFSVEIYRFRIFGICNMQ